MACQGVALAELERLVRELPLNAAEAKQLAARIESQRIPAEAWAALWAVEYRGWKTRFGGLASTEEDRAELPIWLRWVPGDYLYQPNRTLSLFAGYARERQEGSGLTCRESFASAAPYDPRSRLFARNLVGGVLYDLAIPNYNAFELRRCNHEAKLGLVQAAAALKAYTQANGALPETLDALVPTYLDALPQDRYDGAPLRYARAKAVVYSVGDDFADAGGSDPPSQSERSEPTISVAF